MANYHPAIIAREFDLLSELLDQWIGDDATDDLHSQLDAVAIKSKLDRFVCLAEQALPRLEWLMLNAGEVLDAEKRQRFSEIRGQLCQMLAWHSALG